MKRVARQGRRAYVYLDASRTSSCVVMGQPGPAGSWDAWSLVHRASAFEVNSYRKKSGSSTRADGSLTPAGQAAARLQRMIGSGPLAYAFYAHESQLLKIGRSADLPRRWAKLENESGHLRQLVCVWRCDDASATERALHQAWQEHRLFGEWFAAAPVLDDIRRRLDRQR